MIGRHRYLIAMLFHCTIEILQNDTLPKQITFQHAFVDILNIEGKFAMVVRH